MECFRVGPSLCAALVAIALLAVSGPAEAVFWNPQGHGQALVYPYYTVNGGQDTLVTLVNAGSDAKAVKVRFLEARNSRDVLDLDVYLAAGDVWTAAVTADGDGARLVSRDGSCTVPEITTLPQQSIPFSTANFDGSSPLGSDGGPVTADRVREGTIEMIEMGVVTGASAVALSPIRMDEEDAYSDWAGGPPSDCGRLRDAWAVGGYWDVEPTADMAAPTGGLAGTAVIVNVGLGTVQGYVADALGGFHAPGTGLRHTSPAALTPNLSSGTSLAALTWPSGRPFTTSFARGIDAVTAVFMASSIENDFWTTHALGARSEWVVTYPTKRFYTDPYYVGDAAQAPFPDVFAAPGRSCAPAFAFAGYAYDVARHTNTRELGLPYLVSEPRMCFATQVVTFQQGEATDPLDHAPDIPSDVLGSQLVAANFPSSFDNGRAVFSFGWGTDRLVATDGSIFVGQPVTGFLAAQFVNGSVGGALANYTVAMRHRVSAWCQRDAGNGTVERCE